MRAIDFANRLMLNIANSGYTMDEERLMLFLAAHRSPSIEIASNLGWDELKVKTMLNQLSKENLVKGSRKGQHWGYVLTDEGESHIRTLLSFLVYAPQAK